MKKNVVRRDAQISIDLQNSQLHPVIARVYANRHLQKPEENDKSLSKLLSYDGLLNIDKAAQHLFEALQQQKRILIVGDYDVDGAASTALMIRVLRAFGAQQIDFIIPDRFKHGYGLTPALLQEALAQKPELIITVDNGMASHAAIECASQHQIPVVITDHHVAGETLPKAVAIVNPNQPNDHFQSKHLAGVGVAFYVLLALRAKLREHDWFTQHQLAEPNLADYLELVALGTVADIVPFDQNNRILVHQGLQRIRSGKCCLGLNALLSVAGRSLQQVTTRDLAFVVGPRLNASGRLENMTLGVQCLLTDDFAEAEQIALQLNQLNMSRRDLEQQMRREAFSFLNTMKPKELPLGICLAHEGWHEGVIGILASRVKERYHRPVVVFAKQENGELKGSARSVSQIHLYELLEEINQQHPTLLTKFGGHAAAAGLGIREKDYARFADVFDEAVHAQIDTSYLQVTLLSDGELSPEDFTVELAAQLDQAGPWGPLFEEPLFDGQFRLVNQRLVGGNKHLKLTLDLGNLLVDAIVFNVDTDHWPNRRCQRVKAAYKLDINEYQGRQNLQLIIKYLEAVT